MNLVSSNSNLPVVLASSSAVRKKILSESFIPFIVDIPEFDEEQAKQKLVQKFTNNTPQIVIPAGQTSGTLTVSAIDDGIDDWTNFFKNE